MRKRLRLRGRNPLFFQELVRFSQANLSQESVESVHEVVETHRSRA
jgi:hypothetical protein